MANLKDYFIEHIESRYKAYLQKDYTFDLNDPHVKEYQKILLASPMAYIEFHCNKCNTNFITRCSVLDYIKPRNMEIVHCPECKAIDELESVDTHQHG